MKMTKINQEKNVKNKMSAVLKLVDISKNFQQGNQEIHALKQVSLQINRGEVVALIGPSGSGKTTLLQIAGLLDNASSGSIFISEIDIKKSDDQTRTKIRKDNIGFIFQFHHLLPEFSALENVAMPLLIQGKSQKEAFEKAKFALNEVELQDRLNHKPSELSGGQQQRVAIARAFISKPSLILADEPTGNLDSELSEKIFALLQKITKKENSGCLIVTHNQNLACKADRIISLQDGRIILA